MLTILHQEATRLLPPDSLTLFYYSPLSIIQYAWHSYVFPKQGYLSDSQFFEACSNMLDYSPAAPHAIDNLKAKLKSVFKKKGDAKPTEAATDKMATTTKPAEATAAPTAAAATTTAATSGATETKPDAPAAAGKLYIGQMSSLGFARRGFWANVFIWRKLQLLQNQRSSLRS